tara:strand:+ start:83 stop:820 length:738 start_codon:yes stop_codon:yes gene_type:complete
MFDLERGSQSIGSPEAIHKLFGFPVLEPTTFNQFKKTISDLYAVQKTINTVKVGTLDIDQEVLETVPKDGVQIDALILDTFSELSKKYQRSLVNKDGKMQMQDWGKLKNTLDMLLEFITRIPGVLVMNCHSKVRDLGDGTSKVLPYIDGSTKEDISKWFDFVFYTRTIDSPSGTSKYVWQTRHTEKYDHAKDRTNLLPTEMPQDFQKVLEVAREKEFKSCKILVIGSPGSGKTWSLKTLVNKEEA